MTCSAEQDRIASHKPLYKERPMNPTDILMTEHRLIEQV